MRSCQGDTDTQTHTDTHRHTHTHRSRLSEPQLAELTGANRQSEASAQRQEAVEKAEMKSSATLDLSEQQLQIVPSKQLEDAKDAGELFLE